MAGTPELRILVPPSPPHTGLETPWTTRQERLLTKWAAKCNLYKTTHSRAAQRYTRLNTRVGLPTIILSSASASLAIAQAGVDPGTPILVVQIIQGIIMLVSAALSAANHFLGFAQLAERHKQAADMFDTILATIEQELAQARHVRKPSIDFLAHCREEIASLIKTCPVVAVFEDAQVEIEVDDQTLPPLAPLNTTHFEQPHVSQHHSPVRPSSAAADHVKSHPTPSPPSSDGNTSVQEEFERAMKAKHTLR